MGNIIYASMSKILSCHPRNLAYGGIGQTVPTEIEERAPAVPTCHAVVLAKAEVRTVVPAGNDAPHRRT